MVAQFLNDTSNSAVRSPQVYLAFTWGGFGFIIMEYIDGQICGDSDVDPVVASVKTLISIPSLTLVPVPVGGGVIEHPFFIERTSSISYKSVEELKDHINGVSVPFCLALSLSHLGAFQAITLNTDFIRHGEGRAC